MPAPPFYYMPCRARVVHQLKGERSFHIFYQLVRGASPEEKAEFRLPDSPGAFAFLSQSGCMVRLRAEVRA